MSDRHIYSNAAKHGGWSQTGKPSTSTVWRDIYDQMSERLAGSESVLDVGTAEGKRFLRVATSFKRGIGIDLEPEMVKLARQNALDAGVSHLEFLTMDSSHLDLPDGTFDWVISRHAPLSFTELYRILRPGGRVLTEQVHGADKQNLKDAFGRGQGYGEAPDALLTRYISEATASGFTIVTSAVSDMQHVFPGAEKLRSFLVNTPTITDYGRAGDEEILQSFIRENSTSDGIRSNTSCFLLELEREA